METNRPAPTSRVRALLALNVVLVGVIAAFVLVPSHLREPLGNVFLVIGVLILVGALAWAQRQPRLRPRVVRFAWALAHLLLLMIPTLALLEVGVRFVDPGGISYYTEAERYHRLATVPDLRLRYRHRRGFQGVIDKVEVKINSQGLRDGERPFAKPADTFRILVLGDSVPFGWGVPVEKTFTKVLESRLNAEAKRKHYDVINAGVCSYDTRDEVEYLMGEGLRYEPDCVLLFFVPNDLSPILDPRGTTEVLGHRTDTGPWSTRALLWLKGHSRTAQVISHRFAVAPTEERTRRFNRQSTYWKAARERLTALRDLCRQRQLLLVLFGVFANDGPRGERAAARLREFAEEAKVPLVVCDDFFAGENYRRYLNSPVDPHWNAAGHQRVAEGVRRELRRLGVVP